MRKILLIALLIEFCVLVIVFFAYEKTSSIKTNYRKMGLFEGDFPASTPKRIESKEWSGYTFKEDFHFYWKTAIKPDKALAEILSNLEAKKGIKYTAIPVADTCILLFKPLKKGYSVVCALTMDTLLVWIEARSKNTTLDAKFEYMAHFLNSLKVNGVLVAKEPVMFHFRKFQKSIPFWFLQPKSTFFLFLLGVILMANIATFLALFSGGKMPDVVDPQWDLVTPNVIIHEREYLRNTFYSACVAKKQNQILIYTFGKLRRYINLAELQTPPNFQGNKLIISKNLKVEFPDQDSLLKWQVALS